MQRLFAEVSQRVSRCLLFDANLSKRLLGLSQRPKVFGLFRQPKGQASVTRQQRDQASVTRQQQQRRFEWMVSKVRWRAATTTTAAIASVTATTIAKKKKKKKKKKKTIVIRGSS